MSVLIQFILLITSFTFTVAQNYPLCVLNNNWPDFEDYDGKTGFPIANAVDSCNTACVGRNTERFAVRRNGKGKYAKCFCGTDNEGAAATDCDFECGTFQCGGSGKMSIYPVCSGYCANLVCDANNHLCDWSCQEGWHGPICDHPCPRNCSGPCDKDTGKCSSCLTGTHGEFCNNTCSVNCKQGTCHQNGNCTNGCRNGWYTPKCDTKCSNNCANVRCNVETGHCTNGCKDGWYTPKCEAKCSNNCAIVTCDMDTGYCTNGCKDDWYTPHCNLTCPSGCKDKCQLESGNCTNGCDNDTWFGEKCESRCSHRCLNQTCHNNTGDCFSCEVSYFGNTCDLSCSSKCNNSACNFTNGACLFGCLPGSWNTTCSSNCFGHCKDNVCNVADGVCLECADKYFNETCESRCPSNCLDGTCNRYSGTCQTGCQTGWNGSWCEKDVDECLSQPDICSLNMSGSTCINTEGSYDCCAHGIEGTVCAELTDVNNVAVIVGICFAVIIVIAGIAIGVTLFIRKRRKDSNGGQTPGQSHINQTCYIEDIAENNHAKDKSEMSCISQEVSNDYENFVTSNESRETLILTKTFASHVKRHKEDVLRTEFLNLPADPKYDSHDAKRDFGMKKNRFKNILPYNHNRVVLETVDGDPLTDYVNASWIQGYGKNEQFIAAMGPRPETVDDFWRMIWQEKVSTVVMVTNLKESLQDKCHKYWPDNNEESYGDIRVILDNACVYPVFTTRVFRMYKGSNKRQLIQYQFTTWPDHGVPDDGTTLLNFRRKIVNSSDQNVPTLIHCSAGVGRTGTLIALDYLIKQAEAEGQVDVFECVSKLRHQRPNMVQTVDQYIFLHDALAEYIKLGNTTKSCANFDDRGPLINSKEYEVLQDIAPKMNEYDDEYALCAENKPKNRQSDIIPLLSSRAFLISRVKGRNDYINAVLVNGHQTRHQYVVTQIPMAHTVIDFWRMMDDYDINSIVMLLTQEQLQDASHFLPAKNRPLNVRDNVATVRSSLTIEKFRTMDIVVHNNAVEEYSNFEEIMKQDKFEGQKKVKVFEVIVPLKQECLDYISISQMYSELRSWQYSTGHKRVAITCLDGATYSGQCVACFNLFEMMDTDQEVDVFQVSKYVRDSRPQFIGSLDQYCGLYEAARLHLGKSKTYHNA